MFCPECKAEYRPGFTHCNDCDVDLVEELPEAGGAAADSATAGDSAVAWSGPDEGECDAICERLDAAGIPFEITHRAEDFFYGGATSQRLEIRVPVDALEQVQQIVEEFAQEVADRDSGERTSQELKSLELPENDEENAPFDDPIDRNVVWDPRNWHPEDATEKVWAGDDPTLGNMIEVSLRELHIHTRTDALEDGSQQIFVMPEQEARAREIIRQIEEGSPL